MTVRSPARPLRAVVAVMAVAAAALVPVVVAPRTASADEPIDSGVVTVTKTVTRDHLVGGADQVADSRSVTVKVGQTTDLRSQRIAVTWSGAHPTGGLYNDQNFDSARYEEYPMVLMECRGTNESASTPAANRLRPETCWTQNKSERTISDSDDDPDNEDNGPFPSYRLDRYATPADRQMQVGPVNVACSSAAVQHTIPFIDVTGKVYPGCTSRPPEMTGSSTQDRPGNTTYGVTTVDGSGSALFDVWTSDDNASLGCSDTVPCSLVAIPIMGISCDVAAAAEAPADRPLPGADADRASKDCTAKGRFQPGAIGRGVDTQSDLAVTGALWWSASNWRNKIVVPLHFAAAASACDLTSGKPSIAVYGSELMTQAAVQWAPSLCTGSFRFTHVQTEEPQARNLLGTGNIDAAFSSNPPDDPYSTPTVQAPTAVTGFAVTYVIDDAQGRVFTSLKLNARLLAKLLTESYPAHNPVEDPDLQGNPLNITLDPEFLALNPGLKGKSNFLPYSGYSAAAALILSSDSDVIWALTSYMLADPEARQWLDGVPDPWGMHVNPVYRINFPEAQLTLPTYTWPLLSRYEPPSLYTGDSNHCLADDPVPYLPLVAAPVTRMSIITQDMELALPTSTVTCSQPIIGSSVGEKLVSDGRQPPGLRFLLGVTSVADAQRYLLSAAALETTSAVSPSAKITDASGRVFVLPTTDTMRAAAQLAVPNTTTGVWALPYDTLRTSTGASAYPGTMIVNTDVPTTGLSSDDAARYAALLRFIGGAGQTPGLGNGQLPPGYVPMNAANGLSVLSTYTQLAANAVAAQKGANPSLIPTASPSGIVSVSPKPTPTAQGRTSTPMDGSTETTAPSGVTPTASSGAVVPPVEGVSGAVPRGRAVAPTVAPSPDVAAPSLASAGTLRGASAPGPGAVIPVLLFLGLFCGAAAYGTALVTGRRRA